MDNVLRRVNSKRERISTRRRTNEQKLNSKIILRCYKPLTPCLLRNNYETWRYSSLLFSVMTARDNNFVKGM